MEGFRNGGGEWILWKLTYKVFWNKNNRKVGKVGSLEEVAQYGQNCASEKFYILDLIKVMNVKDISKDITKYIVLPSIKWTCLNMSLLVSYFAAFKPTSFVLWNQ